jgi:hypothetical protein
MRLRGMKGAYGAAAVMALRVSPNPLWFAINPPNDGHWPNLL